MIWQEFNFACWEVPDFVPAFREECKREAVELIENLRNHPCIIMWCGSNETDAFYLEIIPPKRPNTYGGYRLYHHDFPQLLSELAPDELYIPSCPCLGLTHGMPNTMGVGTYHGNLPVHQYASDAEYDHVKAYPPFANEIYGIAGDPESSIRRYLDESDLQNWDDPVFVVHNAFFMEACAEKKLFFKYLTYDMPERISDIAPRTLIEYYNEAYCELLKRYTEVFRRKSEICSGAAYWMYNNFSTSMNWAMVDYYGTPKCVWYALKRAYADILPILAVYEDRIDLYLSNLTAKDHRGKLVLSLLSFTGECLFSHECIISVTATKAPLLMQVPSEQLGHFAPQESFLLAEWRDEDGTVVRNHRYRCSPRERRLPNATIELQRLSDRCFKLHGDTLAVNVQLTPWDDKCYPDDNCFDLYPGEDKVITFNVPVNDTPTLHWQNYGAVQLG
jgi:beta-mannosidase